MILEQEDRILDMEDRPDLVDKRGLADIQHLVEEDKNLQEDNHCSQEDNHC